MVEWIKENSIAFTIAVILHLLFIGALLFNWEFDKPKKIVLKQGEVIQTTAVDANSFNAKIAEIERNKKAEQQRKAAEARKQKALQEKKRQEQLRRKQEQKRKQAEAARKKEQQRKAALLKEKQLKEKKLKEKKLREQKLKEQKLQEKKRQEEAEKKAAEEQRKKAEARKKAEQQRKAEAKRKAEAEKKRQAELKRQQERARAERERLSRGIVNKHVALIAQKIERNWRQPLDAPSNLQCKIDIRLRSNGDVISVKIAESSGNASFDRSVETAVRRASPLPVPTDSVIFKQFEVMRLRFEPGNY